MKTKFILSILIFFIFTLSSCLSPSEILQRKCEKAQKRYELKSFKLGCPWQIYDSVNSTNTFTQSRDTTIYIRIPGETVHDSIKIPINSIINTPVNFLETKYSISSAWIENSLLKHTLTQKDSHVSSVIPDALQSKIINTTRIIKVPYPVTKYTRMPMRLYEKIFFFSGLVLWILSISWLVYKFRYRLLYFINH